MERAQPYNEPSPAPKKKSLNPFAGYFDDKKRVARRMKALLRRFPGLRDFTWKRSGKCEGCDGHIGVVHEGQHKRFCDPDCRKGRILPRAYNNYKTA